MIKNISKIISVTVAVACVCVVLSQPAVAAPLYEEGSIVEVTADQTNEEPEQTNEQPERTNEEPEQSGTASKIGSSIDILGLTDVHLDGTIMPNVYIGDVSVGGMSREQALAGCQTIIDDFSNTTVRFVLDDKSSEVTMSQLGYTTDKDAVVDRALACGRKGNPLKRYKDTMELNSGVTEARLEISPQFDVAGRANVENAIASFNQDSVPASISMQEDSTFAIVPEQKGIVVDVDGTIAALTDSLNNNWAGEIEVPVAYTEIIPDANEESLSQMTDELGSYTTNYNGDSGRMRNVENATEFLNGTLLMPGETLDVNAAIEPYTEENGYYYAAEYSGGKVVQGLGGGICQVSTTLYNAVLYAELEVVERYNHSMTVGYVDLSRDAAIAGTVKNFVFKNNMETPVYIAGGCSNGQLTFAIYGKETRPSNRTIEYESKLIETIAPPDEPVETEDPSLAPGERRVTQKAHTGYIAELWKNIYIDGVLQDSVKINSSNYNAAPEYVLVGPGESEGDGEAEPATEASVETPPAEIPVEPPVEIPPVEPPVETPPVETPTVDSAPAEGEATPQ